MSHECTAAKYSEERGNRHVYKVRHFLSVNTGVINILSGVHKVRRDPAYAEKSPSEFSRHVGSSLRSRRCFFTLLNATLFLSSEDMEDSIRAAIRRSGYKARRQAISRSVGVWANECVAMDHVSLEYRTLHNSSTFLQQLSGFISITLWRVLKRNLQFLIPFQFHVFERLVKPAFTPL
ncbi:hypothetical protein COOONC_02492 [Cooperia oncophora]